MPTVSTTDTCDLGFLEEGAPQFNVSLYVTPNNFRGFVGRDEAMRVHVVARAENAETKTPLILEISWGSRRHSRNRHRNVVATSQR